MTQHAFTLCVRPHVPAMQRTARRLARDADVADDLVQEALLRAYRFWDRYQPDTRLRAWLLRIVRNVFISHHRHEQRLRALHTRYGAESPRQAAPVLSEALQAQLEGELVVGLGALPQAYRAVLWTVAVDGASYREAADRLGCPVGTVMSRLHRARRALLPHVHRAA